MNTSSRIVSVVVAMMIALPSIAFSIQNDPPKVVVDAFAKKYPAAEEVEWDASAGDLWVVDFKLAETEFEADFNADGTWLETEHEIDLAQVPVPIIKQLETLKKGESVNEVEMVETSNGISYEFSLSDNREVTIAADGKVMEEQKE